MLHTFAYRQAQWRSFAPFPKFYCLQSGHHESLKENDRKRKRKTASYIDRYHCVHFHPSWKDRHGGTVSPGSQTKPEEPFHQADSIHLTLRADQPAVRGHQTMDANQNLTQWLVRILVELTVAAQTVRKCHQIYPQQSRRRHCHS